MRKKGFNLDDLDKMVEEKIVPPKITGLPKLPDIGRKPTIRLSQLPKLPKLGR
jgi:hypothetical protein